MAQNQKGVASVVKALAQPLADEFGYILWDVEFVKEGSHKILRITIDSEDGITGIHIRLEGTYFLGNIVLDRLIIRSEFLLHLPVYLFLVKRNQLGRKLLVNYFSILNLDSNSSIGQICAVVAGIGHADCLGLMDSRPVVVRADDVIHSLKTVEQVKALLLKLGSVSTAGT